MVQGDNFPTYDISIHAPTRGATYITNYIKLRFHVFQSTLPREERLCVSVVLCVDKFYFNPRSHERSDDSFKVFINDKVQISIHAPTRGATAILHKKFVYFYTIPTINI